VCQFQVEGPVRSRNIEHEMFTLIDTPAIDGRCDVHVAKGARALCTLHQSTRADERNCSCAGSRGTRADEMRHGHILLRSQEQACVWGGLCNEARCARASDEKRDARASDEMQMPLVCICTRTP
jgi:hypothetical protein